MSTISEETYKVGVLYADGWHEQYGFIVNVDGINFFAVIKSNPFVLSFCGLISGELIIKIPLSNTDILMSSTKEKTKELILSRSGILQGIIERYGRHVFQTHEEVEALNNVLKYGERPKMIKQDIREMKE